MKTFFFIVCTILIVFSSSACKKLGNPLILVVLPTSDNPYWQDMISGIEIEKRILASKFDIQISTGSADIDAQRQIEIMNSFLESKKVSAIIIGPASGKQIVPTVAKFNNAGIPVIVVDSKLDKNELKRNNAKVDLFIGSKNEDGGKKAAEIIQSLIGNDRQDVLLIEGSPVHETAIARQNGFMNNSPKAWNIIPKRADWDKVAANRITRAVIETNIPTAIFAASDEMAMGVIAALKSSNISEDKWPIIVGFDATIDGLKAIDEGTMCATIKQNPKKIGQRAVRAAIDLIKGMPGVKGEEYIEVEVIPPQPTKPQKK